MRPTDARIWLEPGLTIGLLAARLDVPEHRPARADQSPPRPTATSRPSSTRTGLPKRGASWADPARVDLPVPTIAAMDALRLRLARPVQRCLPPRPCGQTPTALRRRAFADHGNGVIDSRKGSAFPGAKRSATRPRSFGYTRRHPLPGEPECRSAFLHPVDGMLDGIWIESLRYFAGAGAVAMLRRCCWPSPHCPSPHPDAPRHQRRPPARSAPVAVVHWRCSPSSI